MKSAPGGDTCPSATITWAAAAQIFAAQTSTLLLNSTGGTTFPCNGARVNNSLCEASARAPLPRCAGATGVAAILEAYVPADDFVSVRVLNANTAVAPFVTTGADILIDVVCFPLVP